MVKLFGKVSVAASFDPCDYKAFFLFNAFLDQVGKTDCTNGLNFAAGKLVIFKIGLKTGSPSELL